MIKQIPIKNYIIVFLLTLLTLLGTFYLKKVYENGNISNESKNHLKDSSFVLSADEFLNYIQENGNILLYYSEKYPILEGEFSSYIREKGIKNVVYVENNGSEEEFLGRLKREYSNNDSFSSTDFTSTSFLFLFEDGKIIDFLEVNKTTTIEQIRVFVEKNRDIL